MSHLRYLITALAFAGVVATGCSSSNGTSPDSGPDGQTSPDAKADGKTGGKDSGKDGPTGKDTGTDVTMTSPDGTADGPCNFATFVIGLITTDTTATALPSANLGQACTDDMNQAEFTSLFP
jgi:hypothetical protein